MNQRETIPPHAEEIVTAAFELADESVRLLRGLLAASRNGEDATQATVLAMMRDDGFEAEAIHAAGRDIPVVDELAEEREISPTPRMNVAGRLRGVGSGPSLLLWAHPDGMQFDGAAGWTRDPFAGEEDNGRIYGWGIADDLSGVATMLMVPRVLDHAGLQLGGDLVLASTPSKGHARGVLAVLNAGYRADAGIYLHPAESGNGLGDIKALAAGILRFRITVKGQAPDTAEPNHLIFAHQGVDPIEKMELLLAALRALSRERAERVRHPALDAFVGQSAGMLVGTIEGGETPSRIARRCEAVVSLSSPPGERFEDLRAEVERCLAGAVSRDSWLSEHPPVIDWLFGTTGVEVAPDDHAYVVVQKAIEAVTGSTPRYYPGHSASEIRHPILNHGIPSVGIGPRCGSLTQAGGTDEWLDLDDYQRMIAVCALVAVTWCGTEGK